MSTRSIVQSLFAIITSLITTFTSSAYGCPLFLGRFEYIVKIYRKRFLSNLNLAHLAALLLVLVSVKAYSSALEPEPSIVSAIPTETTVTLEWSVTPPITGKTTYTMQYCSASNGEVCADYINAKSTKSLSGVVQGLVGGTAISYFFRIYARDAHGNDATGESYGPVNTSGEPPVVGQCNYPTFGGTSAGLAGLDSFTLPVWANEFAHPTFVDEFDPSGSTESWIIEDMHDSLNQAGNAGIDETGNSCVSNCRPSGKRWSAWYDEDDYANWSDTISGFSGVDSSPSGVSSVSGLGADGVLELGGVQVSGSNIDLTRPGAGQWNDNRLYTAWIKTWARDPMATNSESESNVYLKDKWTAPMYLETSVNFANMNTPGFRFSMWLMPATYDAEGLQLATGNEAYDGNFDNGFEIDIFEFEPWSPDCREMVEFAWHNSFATKGKRGENANGKFHLNGIDANVAHTIGFLWETGKMQWVFDEKVVLEITDPAKIPTIYQYLNLSREMTNGYIEGQATYDGSNFFLPPEGGLYGYEGSSKLGNYFDSVNDDKAVIGYVKIYQP